MRALDLIWEVCIRNRNRRAVTLGACRQTGFTSTAHRNLASVDPFFWNAILGATFGTTDYLGV
jgi:hypothetical protein